ncbi:hypothetical protein PVAND_012403 [Polypedilum vanderplanki]|uniref:Odorant receptor n=1 Tax=Polypedilum vanderplanki TaxID=319348 RepID=A0A9J6CMD4_POLVA|nr:hypothetical protein PVAND_012403 [Polypedilum vanderplanki]
MSIVQIKSVSDYAKYITFACIMIMIFGYLTSFWILMNKFDDLFNDISETFTAKPLAMVNLKILCLALTKTKFKKIVAVLSFFTIFSIESLITGKLIIPMWNSQIVSETPKFFYIFWFYQTIVIYYLGIVAILLHDMFFDILNVINCYSNYFVNELKNLDLNGADAKEILKDCIKMHQNIQRLVWKFTKIVRYPISFQITLTAYILCTSIFIINKNSGPTGFLIMISIFIMIEILEICAISQQIETASGDYADALMECNWLKSDVEIKKLILFFLKNLMFPILKFNLFGMISVNLKTFLKILNAAYRANAVLNHLEKNK